MTLTLTTTQAAVALDTDPLLVLAFLIVCAACTTSKYLVQLMRCL